MPTLISSDDALRRYIPNVLASVRGETSLFDKLSPCLTLVEQWVATTFTSTSLFNQLCLADESSLLRIYTAKVVVSQAFMQAVPSLDLVLTPNGFGIVSNANIAPASKERVERLILSLEQERDAAIQLLLSSLAACPDWHPSVQCGYFSATLFPNLDICDVLGVVEHKWQKYQELRPKVISIESELASNFISEAQFDIFRAEVLSPSSDSLLKKSVIRVLRSEIVRLLQTNTALETLDHLRPSHNLLHIVDIIKKNPDEFPEWHNSPTAALFTPTIFENKKDDKAYWF